MQRRLIFVITLVFIIALPALASPSDGPALFKAKCASCHGADGSGSTPVGKSMKVRDLRSDAVQKQTDIELTKTISGGKGKMPAYGKSLSVDDIKALIAHVRTLHGAPKK